MLLQGEIADLSIGDYIKTPDGIGTFKGRVRQGRHVTHVIVHHHIRNVGPDASELMQWLQTREIVVQYPVHLVGLP